MIDALIKADKQFDLLLMPGETQSAFNMWMGYGLDAELRCFEEHLRVIRNCNDEQRRSLVDIKRNLDRMSVNLALIQGGLCSNDKIC